MLAFNVRFNALQQAFTWYRFAPAARELTWSNWIIWMAPEPSGAIMDDERIRTVDDAWQHAIGKLIATLGTERQPPWSRFHGVVPTPSYSTTDIRSFFDQCASTGSPEQHGHAQRLLEYRLALVRSLAQPRPTDVVLDLGCGNGHHL